MKTPSVYDLEIALLWLDNNESDDAEACKRVVVWLDAHIAIQKRNEIARSLSKETGRPLAVVKQIMKKRGI